MKFVVAIIQPDRLHDVLDELENRDIHLVTVTQVLGRGRQKGVSQVYRSHVETGNLLRKIKIEVAITDDFLPNVLEALKVGAQTSNIGDGKIFVFELDQCIRIRTGEEGPMAIGS
ncbi:transcriptional regulator [PVC group bacterium (ex Bugula neritina AB1)]|nr:transcriptional regulator [PVC group bacterium (ex Bugula neritina AB1)]